MKPLQLWNSALDTVLKFHEATKVHKSLLRTSKEEIDRLYRIMRQEGVGSIWCDEQPHQTTEPYSEHFSLPLADALNRRHSTRNFSDTPINMETFQNVFGMSFCTNNIALRTEADTSKQGRPYPSPGAMYPIRHYLFRRSDEQANTWSAYEFIPRTAQFNIRNSNIPEALVVSAFNLKYNASALYVQTMFLGFIIGKYRALGYRMALIEAGAAMQTLLLTTTAQNIRSLAWGGVFNDEANALLGCNGIAETTVNAVFLGYEAKTNKA